MSNKFLLGLLNRGTSHARTSRVNRPQSPNPYQVTLTEGLGHHQSPSRLRLAPFARLVSPLAVQVVLSVGGDGWSHPRLAGPGLSSSQAKLGAWVVAEDIKREVARSRNDLESYIIKMKDNMEGDELLAKVGTGFPRQNLSPRDGKGMLRRSVNSLVPHPGSTHTAAGQQGMSHLKWCLQAKQI